MKLSTRLKKMMRPDKIYSLEDVFSYGIRKELKQAIRYNKQVEKMIAPSIYEKINHI